jgi:8-oxo-dGTP diphosphatase
VTAEIPYTICFCRCKNLVLMLLRSRPPNAGLWNGLGGKILPGETPLRSTRREVLEEAGIDLRGSARVRFGGAVRWLSGVDPTGPSTGMHAFVADLRPGSAWEGTRETPEGLLSWKTLDWVCDPENGAVVSNIPRFLPDILQNDRPTEYRCEYVGESLVGITTRPL